MSDKKNHFAHSYFPITEGPSTVLIARERENFTYSHVEAELARETYDRMRGDFGGMCFEEGYDDDFTENRAYLFGNGVVKTTKYSAEDPTIRIFHKNRAGFKAMAKLLNLPEPVQEPANK